ncbi:MULTISPECIES: EamA family transporter [unclassified Sedimentibacter]|uniref:EamA family transporter n=1 Tax=unclassified Sedimentibacter TaxID=2649220 RepID=UPI0027E09E21|nr:EamA family transporter [Sedimentibacter sp. MB35-C1]WMJ78637.1 EamA family transporter [Sedimentibacter sp. MB35-C1]
MIYLALSILCGILVAVIFRMFENQKINLHVIITFNYISALIVSLIIVVYKNMFNLISLSSLHNFMNEYNIIFRSTGILSIEASAGWAIITGTLFGPIFCFSFFQYQKNISISGMGIASTFMKISVVIPMIISMLFWKEYPSLMQSAGIILCIISILIFNLDFENIRHFKLNKNLILLIILGGLAQFTAKVYQKYGSVDCRDILTLFIFLSSFITSLILLLRHKSYICAKDVIIGLTLGIPNLFNTTFLVLALSYIDTSIAYMLSSLISIIIILIIGLFFFKEKIYKKDILGLIIALVSIYFINN